MSLILVMSAAAVAVAQDVPSSIDACLACHDDPDLSMSFEDGTLLSLHVSRSALVGSIHEGIVACADCHKGYDDDHPFGETFASRRAYVLRSYEMCKECHFDTYTRTLESVHYELMKSGDQFAPVCTDCHGAHDIHDPHEKHAMISRSCAVCHADVNEQYRSSVHGRALEANASHDVPGCASCHESHRTEHPDTTRFKLNSPAKCIGCHGDEQLMGRYGISTYVATSYLTDFHGVTASFAATAVEDPRQVVVTCVDCHGHHDTPSPSEVGDERMKANVVATCARCHENAAPDFPAAWLSHYEPSLRHAPLVYLVDLFYMIFIPFVVIGLALQVVLHLFRFAAGR